MSKNNLDMTQGNALKLLTTFTLPSLASSLLSQVYSLTDSLIVGQFLGETPLAAIGVCIPIVFLIGSMIIGLNVGVGITMGQCFGRRDYSQMRHALANSIYLGLGLGLFSAFAGPPLAGTILRLMGTPEGPMADATSYLRITFLSTVFPTFYYLFSNAFRGMGDSKSALYCLIVSVVCNIGLDYLFIAAFHLGVAGTAYATALAQGLSVVFAIIMLYRKYPKMRFTKADLHPDWKLFGAISKLSLPIAAQYGFNNLGNVLVQGCINGFGETVMASYTAASRLSTFCLMPTETIGSSLSVYAGQNYGAGKKDRICLGVHAAMIMNAAVSAVLAAVILLFGKLLVQLFMDEPAEKFVAIAWNSLLLAAVPGVIYGAAQVYQQVLRGIGQANYSMVGSFFQLSAKLLIAAIGTFWLKNLDVVWLSWPISYIVGCLYPCWYYKKKSGLDQLPAH